MTILAIESSAVTAGCAVAVDGNVIAEGFINSGLTHSQTLMPLISDTVSKAGITTSDIDCIAVSCGPGSFTGVRIGVGTAKGIAFTRNIPCVGVSTLEAIAHNAAQLGGLICAVMDARRDQVYNALFMSSDGTVTRLTEDRAISVDALSEELNSFDQTIWLCGDGAQMCAQRIASSHDNLVIAPEHCRWQSGRGVAAAAQVAIYENKKVDPEVLVPTYLRLPQAERELKKKQSDDQLEG